MPSGSSGSHLSRADARNGSLRRRGRQAAGPGVRRRKRDERSGRTMRLVGERGAAVGVSWERRGCDGRKRAGEGDRGGDRHPRYEGRGPEPARSCLVLAWSLALVAGARGTGKRWLWHATWPRVRLERTLRVRFAFGARPDRVLCTGWERPWLSLRIPARSRVMSTGLLTRPLVVSIAAQRAQAAGGRLVVLAASVALADPREGGGRRAGVRARSGCAGRSRGAPTEHEQRSAELRELGQEQHPVVPERPFP
jgi:hypothetical protein